MWVLPTINRPEQCKAVLERLIATGISTPGILIVNGGDYENYDGMKLPEKWLKFSIPTNIGVCGAMASVLLSYPNEPWYGLICDDEFIDADQKHWDLKLVEAAGAWKIAHGNEQWRAPLGRIHGFPVFGGELVRAMGFWALPGLWHWFVDDCWELLAHECNLRVFLEDVKIEHKHWSVGKSPVDDIYRLGESRAIEDHKVFMEWKDNGAIEVIERIKKLRLCSEKN